MSDSLLQAAAKEFEQAAQELELAAQHLRTAAQHFRSREIPRGCAHAFAAHGHIHTAQTHLDHRAVVHASQSNPV